MKVILTGAAGFIGSCFLWQLNAMGTDDVWIVDAAEENGKRPTLAKKKFKDYLTRDQLLLALGKGQFDDVDAIVHLGACADTTERDEAFLRRNNLEYSQTLAKWALSKNKIFHYASSAAIYGDGKKGYSDNPKDFEAYLALNLYGESKRLFDKWIMEEGLLDKVVGFRYFNVFGPNEYLKGDMRSMVSKAFDQIKGTGEVKLFGTSREGFEDGSEERDFVYVKDILKVMTYFLENPTKHGIFNLGTGQARSFKDLATSVFSALNKDPNIHYIPMPEKLRDQYQYFTQADLNNLRSAGYTHAFHTLEESVRDYVKSYLVQPDPYL